MSSLHPLCNDTCRMVTSFLDARGLCALEGCSKWWRKRIANDKTLWCALHTSLLGDCGDDDNLSPRASMARRVPILASVPRVCANLAALPEAVRVQAVSWLRQHAAHIDPVLCSLHAQLLNRVPLARGWGAVVATAEDFPGKRSPWHKHSYLFPARLRGKRCCELYHELRLDDSFVNFEQSYTVIGHALWLVRTHLAERVWVLLPELAKAAQRGASLDDAALFAYLPLPGLRLLLARTCGLACHSELPWSAWFPLDLGATLVSRVGDTLADYRTLAGQLDSLALEVRTEIEDRGAISSLSRIKCIVAVLSGRHGFGRFSAEHPLAFAPESSYLSAVLSHKAPGLPITLSLLYLCVAARVGVPLRGSNTPAHYLCDFEGDNGERIFLDARNEGRTLTKFECLRMLQITEEDLPKPEPDYHSLLFARMFRNLATVFQSFRGSDESYHATFNSLLALQHEPVRWGGNVKRLYELHCITPSTCSTGPA